MGNQIPSLYSLWLLFLLGTSPMAHAASEFKDEVGGINFNIQDYQISPSNTLSDKSTSAESRQLRAGIHLGLGGSISPLSQAFNTAGINPVLLGLGQAAPVLASPLLTQRAAINRIGTGLENSPFLGSGLGVGGLTAGKPNVGGLDASGLDAAGLGAIGLGSPGIGARSLGVGPSPTQGVGLNSALTSGIGGTSILPSLATGQYANTPVSDLLKLATYLNSEDWEEILGVSNPGSSALNSLTPPLSIATDRKSNEETNALIQTLKSLQNTSPIAAGTGLPLGPNLQSPVLMNPLLQRMLTANALQLAQVQALREITAMRAPYLAAQKRSLELASPNDTQQRHPSSSQKYTSQKYYSNPYHHEPRYGKTPRVSSGFIEISGKPSSSERNYFPRRSTRREYTDRYNRRDRSFSFPRDV